MEPAFLLLAEGEGQDTGCQEGQPYEIFDHLFQKEF
jgi:hypothetical protein